MVEQRNVSVYLPLYLEDTDECIREFRIEAIINVHWGQGGMAALEIKHEEVFEIIGNKEITPPETLTDIKKLTIPLSEDNKAPENKEKGYDHETYEIMLLTDPSYKLIS